MLNETLRFSSKETLDGLIKIAIGIVLLCILSPIKLGAGTQVPITLQSMLVVLLPIVFGWKNGALAVLIYLILGGMGLPVFAEYSSGWSKFMGTSGGFLLGFLVAANIVGFFAQKDFRMQALAALILLVLGQLTILGMGLFWMSGIVQQEINYANQLESFMPGVLLKSAFGMILFVALSRLAKYTSK